MRRLASVQRALKILKFFSGTKTTVIGKENIPTDDSVLYVANHRSFFDIVVACPECVGPTGFIAKQSIMKWPLLGKRMEQVYCLALDRENNREALKTILKGVDYMKNGISLFIFPEGTRSKADNDIMGAFHEGSLKLAEKSKKKIVPVAITNSDAVLEQHFPKIRAAHVCIEYLPPIDTAELSREEKKELGSNLHSMIQEAVIKNRALI